MKNNNQCLASALGAFPYEEQITGLAPFGSGHINDTYAVMINTDGKPRVGYILQRLNTKVFTKPHEVMENIIGVTEYLQGQLNECGEDSERGTLNFFKTVDGESSFFDEQGMPWRSYRFIENSFCYEECPTPEIFYHSARVFGLFLCRLINYPAHTLHETIPGFHDTCMRLNALKNAVKSDPLGRAANCKDEIDFALSRENDCGFLQELQARGELPLRVTHNDTKLNNVLFDETTGKALCVIDLDTIMPGLSAHDFGDSIRFGATTASEDEPDLYKVHFSLQLYDAYTKGYLEAVNGALTEKEKEVLPQGARLITLECGMRFLTDYLEGDNYFKVDHLLHNLHRCRTQFKLVQEMEENMNIMQEIIVKHSKIKNK